MAGQDAWSPKRTKIKSLLLMVESTQTVSRTCMFGGCLFYERSKFHLLMVKMPPEIKYATQIAFLLDIDEVYWYVNANLLLAQMLPLRLLRMPERRPEY